MVHDVFGRERHKLHSDNMGGVGSFEKDCRTLYVGRLGKHYELEDILWKEFGEWGEIEVQIDLSSCAMTINLLKKFVLINKTWIKVMDSVKLVNKMIF